MRLRPLVVVDRCSEHMYSRTMNEAPEDDFALGEEIARLAARLNVAGHRMLTCVRATCASSDLPDGLDRRRRVHVVRAHSRAIRLHTARQQRVHRSRPCQRAPRLCGGTCPETRATPSIASRAPRRRASRRRPPRSRGRALAADRSPGRGPPRPGGCPKDSPVSPCSRCLPDRRPRWPPRRGRWRNAPPSPGY